ncbi:hypothetical protein B0T11DRAFT_286185 [Plectosphaerella cucumerina]|uniref:Uncharacterized protein n=1 Tax=Plectosphaerella cucumerina TaxID=40658 RepID=A0A8K0X227_9PEZI|nr:hypothetical protein B0T11DRAFT_286185 [Plectosphaerella cucumerina]
MAELDQLLPTRTVEAGPSRPASAADHTQSLDEASFPWVIEDKPVGRIQSEDFASLLPASRRVGDGDLASPHPSTVLEVLDKAVQLDRLHTVHRDLWLAGRPMPPRPLYVQKILNRDIFITEDLDMHLVWGNGRIYLKPLPRFLFEPCFWKEVWQCSCKSLQSQPPEPPSSKKPQLCGCKLLARCRDRARGVLFSYIGLVSNKSDHDIAIESKLFPEILTWSKWQRVVAHMLNDPELYTSIDRRFLYGELRLSRLNKVYFYWHTPGKQYKSQWNQYSSFFDDNLAFIGGTFAYFVIILTAMQVGLGTAVKGNAAFMSISNGFAIFVIFGLIGALGLVMIAFLYLFANNWVATKIFEWKRKKELKTHGVTLQGSKIPPVC